MEDELKSKLVEVIGSIQSAAGKASDFAIGQLPDIAQQYLNYGRAYAIVSLALSLCVCAVAAVLTIDARQRRRNDLGSDSFFDFLGGAWWITAGVWVLGLFYVAGSTKNALLVWMAPKVWLLKELAALVR